ncbi:MAG: aminoacyl-histidine dipeptidase [Bacteroidales bacterium]|nr:aminoacyl-histidine dipeptidase [Bacteroidales bacterium]
MEKISNLEPNEVWGYFEELCKIPRPSKQEDQILQYLLDFADKQNLETQKDRAGNLLIKKPAAKGNENLKPVVLQSHVDMVGEKNQGTEHDFGKDPIKPYIDGDWVKAEGTTLGADNGLGIAAQLALLTSDDISHGPLECLFTVDEETGLTGAFALPSGFFEGKILINLDSEDWGELFIGCAGGIDTVATFEFDREKVPEDHQGFKIQVTGLNGGHSGDEIHKKLGNALKIVNRFLWNISEDYDVRISSFDGGRARNAIPREAEAHVSIHEEDVENVKHYFSEYEKQVKNELKVTEPGLKLSFEQASLPGYVIDEDIQHELINALYACPHGVYAWSQEMEDLVETSTNLAAIKTQENGSYFITTSQRSSVDSAKDDISSMVESVFRLANARVEHSAGYPGWQPNTDSEILQITEDAYKRLFNKEPEVKAIHAGLECGLFLQKYPYLDMISIGPTIKGAHTPEERASIETTKAFWELLVEVLRNIPEDNSVQ